MLKLYHDPDSRSVRALITLRELQVDHHIELVSLKDGAQLSERHLERHPLGQLPVLEDEGRYMFESVAICLHLADRFPEARLAPVPASPDRALYLQWCVFTTGSLEPAISGAFLRSQGTAPLPGTPSLDNVLRALGRPLTEHDYLLATGFSTADILVGATLAFVARRGPPMPGPVAAYLERLQARPSFQ